MYILAESVSVFGADRLRLLGSMVCNMRIRPGLEGKGAYRRNTAETPAHMLVIFVMYARLICPLFVVNVMSCLSISNLHTHVLPVACNV